MDNNSEINRAELILSTKAWEEVELSDSQKIIKPRFLHKNINWIDIQKLKDEKLPFIHVKYLNDKIVYLEAHAGIVRELPVYYSISNGKVVFSDSPDSLIQFIEKVDLDKLSIIEFLSFGYVTANRTLLKGVYSLQAGEVLTYNDGIKIDSEYIYNTSPITDETPKALLHRLKSTSEEVFHDLILSLKGKKAIVPLSGGYDSRFIVSMLKRGGFNNVVCYSWGVDEKEIKISRAIAKKLGYKWKKIDYSKKSWDESTRNEWFRDCMRYVSKFTSISGAASYPFLNYLKNQSKEDSILIPGHTGDFIAGGHIPATLKKNSLNNDVVTSVFNFHALANGKFSKYPKDLFSEIYSQISSYAKIVTDLYRTYEIWEWRNRQSKFIANTNRHYEYFGYSWNMPLWNVKFVDFWSSVPLEEKRNMKLYDRFLETEIFKKLGLQYDYDLKRRGKKNILSSIKNNLYFLKKNRMIKDVLSRIRSKSKQSDQFGFEFSLPTLYSYADRDFPKAFSIVERYKKQFHLESKSSYFYLAQYVLSMLVEDFSAISK